MEVPAEWMEVAYNRGFLDGVGIGVLSTAMLLAGVVMLGFHLVTWILNRGEK